ncbi:MAG: PilZ domain-containing protein [Nitrospirae bacterium]|nr:PilZ domain-containing protein [Nitrospirota bacterium]
MRVVSQGDRVARLLGLVNVLSFRCQLCTNHFRSFSPGARHETQASDRRQYTRLAASIDAQVLDRNQPAATNRITDISMDGCTLQATGLSKGTIVELRLKPTVEEDTIRIERALVCSIRPTSTGIKFLSLQPEYHRRLGQVVLGLLVSQRSYLSSHE